MLGNQTRCGKMEGADESTEPRWHPYLTTFKIKGASSKLFWGGKVWAKLFPDAKLFFTCSENDFFDLSFCTLFVLSLDSIYLFLSSMTFFMSSVVALSSIFIVLSLYLFIFLHSICCIFIFLSHTSLTLASYQPHTSLTLASYQPHISLIPASH